MNTWINKTVDWQRRFANAAERIMPMPRDAERMCWDRQLGSWSRDRLNVDAFAVRLGPEHEIGGKRR